MKGAIADPWLRIINVPNKTRTSIIGRSQYFFLILKNSQNSFIKDIIKNLNFFKIPINFKIVFS